MSYAYECIGCGHLALRHQGTAGDWRTNFPAPLDRKFKCLQCPCVLGTLPEVVAITRQEYASRHLVRAS